MLVGLVDMEEGGCTHEKNFKKLMAFTFVTESMKMELDNQVVF